MSDPKRAILVLLALLTLPGPAEAQSFIVIPRPDSIGNLFGVDVISTRQRGEGFTFAGLVYAFAPAQESSGDARDQVGGISYGFLSPVLEQVPLLLGGWGSLGASYGCGSVNDPVERGECDHDLGWQLVNPFIATALSVGIAHRAVLWQGSIGAVYTHGSFYPAFRFGASFVWSSPGEPERGG